MKKHFDVLDGLRGTAALMVVIFHLLEPMFPHPADNPLHHAYLAVDFFFMLSGYVVGHAYDDRWPKMTIGKFIRIRLIRLHPLVVMGVLLGAVTYVLDPFVSFAAFPWMNARLVAAFITGLLLIPFYPLPFRFDDTHAFNGPSWTMLQEYLINLVYALLVPSLTKRKLNWIVGLSALALVVTAIVRGNLHGGWAWRNCWMAPVRVSVTFFGGLWLYRSQLRWKIAYPFPVLSLLLVLAFTAPYSPWNGLLESLFILAVFPIIILLGSGSAVSGIARLICKWMGKLSYPIYITHYPFIYLYYHWIEYQHPDRNQLIVVGLLMLIGFVLIAWLALRLYDEPVRKWLNERWAMVKAKGNV